MPADYGMGRMRVLRDALPFGVFGAPLSAIGRELLFPGLAAFGLVSFVGGAVLAWRTRGVR